MVHTDPANALSATMSSSTSQHQTPSRGSTSVTAVVGAADGYRSVQKPAVTRPSTPLSTPTPTTRGKAEQLHPTPATPPRLQQQQRHTTPHPSSIALPRHFLVRPTTTHHTANGRVTEPGTLVPLVPMDQLPAWIDIVGVPRALSAEQAAAAGLVNLGVVARGPEVYEVRLLHGGREVATTDGADTGRPISLLSRSSRAAVYIPAPETKSSASAGPSSHEARLVLRPAAAAPGLDPAAATFESVRRRRQAGSASLIDPATSSPNNNNNTAPHTSQQQQRAHASRYHPARPRPHAPPYTRVLASETKEKEKEKGKKKIASSNSSPSPSPNPNSDLTPNPNSSLNINTDTKHTNPTPTTTTSGSGIGNLLCRHWCHHGRCKWGATCRYAHAMPGRAEDLRAVGLGDWPAWFRTAVGVAFGMVPVPPLVSGASGGGGGGGGGGGRGSGGSDGGASHGRGSVEGGGGGDGGGSARRRARVNYLEMDLDTDRGTDERIGVVDGKPGSLAEERKVGPLPGAPREASVNRLIEL